MIGIWQADKWDALIPPVLLKRGGGSRSNRENFSPARREVIVAVPQARQRRAAIWSHEAAQEIQNDDFVFLKPRKPDSSSERILQFKIGRTFARCDQFIHPESILLPSPKHRRTFFLSIFPSMYFAGWGGRNKAGMKDEGLRMNLKCDNWRHVKT